MRASLPALGLMLCAGSALAADPPGLEISVNYAFLHEQGTGGDQGLDLPVGWSASIAGHLSGSLSLVGDVGGGYKTDRDVIVGVPIDVKLSVHSLHGGLRFSPRGGEGVKPYVQALAGATRLKATGSAVIGDTVIRIGDTTTRFSIQPGLGLDVRVSDSLSFGIGGDFRLIFLEEEKSKQFRARAGLVFRLGGR